MPGPLYSVRCGWFLPAVSSTATATAAVAATTTAAIAAIFTWLGFIHVDGAPIKLCCIQSVDRRLAFTAVRHLYESKTAGPARHFVHDDPRRINTTELLKGGSHAVFRGVITKISNVYIQETTPPYVTGIV